MLSVFWLMLASKPSRLPAEVHVSRVDELQELLQRVSADLVGVQSRDLFPLFSMGGEILTERSEDVTVSPELHVLHHYGDVTQKVHLPLLVQALQEQLPMVEDMRHHCCWKTGEGILITNALATGKYNFA